jgi:hypothetical protein
MIDKDFTHYCFVELLRARIDAQDHFDFAIALKEVFEKQRKLGVAIRHHLK